MSKCKYPEETQETCLCLDIDGECLYKEFYLTAWECIYDWVLKR